MKIENEKCLDGKINCPLMKTFEKHYFLVFVFETIEARWAASTGPAFGNEESKCLT